MEARCVLRDVLGALLLGRIGLGRGGSNRLRWRRVLRRRRDRVGLFDDRGGVRRAAEAAVACVGVWASAAVAADGENERRRA